MSRPRKIQEGEIAMEESQFVKMGILSIKLSPASINGDIVMQEANELLSADVASGFKVISAQAVQMTGNDSVQVFVCLVKQ
jgi:hypothetical protein